MNETENRLLREDLERLIAEAEGQIQRDEFVRAESSAVDGYKHSSAVAFWCVVTSALMTRGDFGRGFLVEQWRRMSRAQGENLRRDMAAYARQSGSVRVRVFVLEFLRALPAGKASALDTLLPLYVPGLDGLKGEEHGFRYQIVLASLFHGGGAIQWMDRAGRFAQEVKAGL